MFNMRGPSRIAAINIPKNKTSRKRGVVYRSIEIFYLLSPRADGFDPFSHIFKFVGFRMGCVITQDFEQGLVCAKDGFFHSEGENKKSNTPEGALLFKIRSLLAQIIAQFSADGGVAQAAEGLRFDLPDALTGDAHFATNFFKSVGLTV